MVGTRSGRTTHSAPAPIARPKKGRKVQPRAKEPTKPRGGCYSAKHSARGNYIKADTRCYVAKGKGGELVYLGEAGRKSLRTGKPVCKGKWFNMRTGRCKKYERGPFFREHEHGGAIYKSGHFGRR